MKSSYIWKTFCQLDRASSIKTDFQTCNLQTVISKSVFRYCKISLYSPNIDIVLFYGKYTNIDIYAQYQEIYTDILVLSVFFSIIMKPFKNIFLLFIHILKTFFCFVYLLKRTTPNHTMLVFCCYCFILERQGKACHAMLACCC